MSDRPGCALGLCMSPAQGKLSLIKGRDCLRDQGRGSPVLVEGLSGDTSDSLASGEIHNPQKASCRQRSF